MRVIKNSQLWRKITGYLGAHQIAIPGVKTPGLARLHQSVQPVFEISQLGLSTPHTLIQSTDISGSNQIILSNPAGSNKYFRLRCVFKGPTVGNTAVFLHPISDTGFTPALMENLTAYGTTQSVYNYDFIVPPGYEFGLYQGNVADTGLGTLIAYEEYDFDKDVA